MCSARKPFVIGLLVLLPLAGIVFGLSDSTLRFANIFGDHMVLQQGKPVRIWGWASPGADVTVTITESDREVASIAGEDALQRPHQRQGEQVERGVLIKYVERNSPSFKTVSANASADQDGLWVVTLRPLSASFAPKYIVALAGDQRAAIVDVPVGEVWVCSGQSNMQWGLGGDTEWDVESESADYPAVRYCSLGKWSAKPLKDLADRVNWVGLSADYDRLNRVSGVSYYFAVRLHRYLKVPIGIVHNAVGGTLAESWTSRKALEGLPQLRGFLEDFDKSVTEWPQEKRRREVEYEAKVAKAKAEGRRPPRPLRLGGGPTESRNLPGACHNGMVLPIGRLAVRGALFFQGENNSIGKWDIYRYSFPKLIDDWRSTFGDPDLPFGIISLFGFSQPQRDREPELDALPPGLFWYAAIRDVHFRTFESTAHTGLIAAFDVGDADNIHPHRKGTVGQRAARWALAKVYGKPVAYTGPVYRAMRAEGDKIKLFFDLDPKADPNGPWYASCPITRAGEYSGFVIAGEDRHFYPAKVRRNDKEHCLEVWSEHVPKPAAVRYGWANYPDGNVIGIEHLPAHPFRTDDWPLLEQPPYEKQARRAWDQSLKELRDNAGRRVWQRKLKEVHSLLSELKRDGGKLLGQETKDAWQGEIEEIQRLISGLADEVAHD
jgi:sialate O-acetylesterase